jgi:hypothetical protein
MRLTRRYPENICTLWFVLQTVAPSVLWTNPPTCVTGHVTIGAARTERLASQTRTHSHCGRQRSKVLGVAAAWIVPLTNRMSWWAD